MPEKIRSKLAQDPGFLEVLRQYQDKDLGEEDHRYWCFPPFESGVNLERSVTPNRGSAYTIDDESIDDYLQFPDPLNYMIGFLCGEKPKNKVIVK